VSYDRLRDEQERPTKRIVDWTATWGRLEPLAAVGSDAAAALEHFCKAKRITVAALEQLGARIAVRQGGYWLAFSGSNGDGRVTALKYRPLGGSSHETIAEKPSTWLRPIVAGKLDSTDWLIAEGETDAARLLGLVGDVAAVLALPAGAKTFKKEWAALIPRGATVALCHDADEDGDAGAAKAAKILGGTTVRVRPPVDGTDWCDFTGDRAEFLELVKAARPSESASGIVLIDPRDIEIRNVEWLIRGYLPVGELVILQGHGGTNKGTLTCHWAARVTTGDVPGGKPGGVLFVAAEDDYERVLKPRLLVAGANLELVRFVEFRREGVTGSILIPDDIPALEAAIGETSTRLTIIDPLMSHLAGSVDSYRDHDVKLALRPLSKMANATGCTVSGVHHFTKSTDKGALRSGQGSGAFGNTARLVLAMAADPEDEQMRVLEVVKSNVSRIGLREDVRVELVPLAGIDDPIPRTVPTGIEGKTVEQLLHAAKQHETAGTSAAEMQAVVLRTLATGECPRQKLDDAVQAATGSKSDNTWKRALVPLRDEGRIKSRKDGTTGPWLWRLTDPDGWREPVAEATENGASFHLRETSHSAEIAETAPYTKSIPSSMDKPFLAEDGIHSIFEDGIVSAHARARENGTPAGCQTCGSNKIGKASGRCRKCGTKAGEALVWSSARELRARSRPRPFLRERRFQTLRSQKISLPEKSSGRSADVA